MKKIVALIISLFTILSLAGCGSRSNTITPSTDDTPSTTIPSDTTPSDNTSTEDDELMNKTIVFKIGNTEVNMVMIDSRKKELLLEIIQFHVKKLKSILVNIRLKICMALIEEPISL